MKKLAFALLLALCACQAKAYTYTPRCAITAANAASLLPTVKTGITFDSTGSALGWWAYWVCPAPTYGFEWRTLLVSQLTSPVFQAIDSVRTGKDYTLLNNTPTLDKTDPKIAPLYADMLKSINVDPNYIAAVTALHAQQAAAAQKAAAAAASVPSYTAAGAKPPFFIASTSKSRQLSFGSPVPAATSWNVQFTRDGAPYLLPLTKVTVAWITSTANDSKHTIGAIVTPVNSASGTGAPYTVTGFIAP